MFFYFDPPPPQLAHTWAGAANNKLATRHLLYKRVTLWLSGNSDEAFQAQTVFTFKTLHMSTLENTEGKGENIKA